MAERDLYRNRDFIPDFDTIMAETEARSRALAASSRIERDLGYGPTPRQSFDLVFPPDPVPGAPLHMFIHGGYWRAGSKEAHTLVAAPVIAAGGIAALVGYDLMPDTRLAEIVAQVRAATRHLVRIAPAFGADPARFTVSGHSAGAHLASLLAAEAPGDRTTPDLAPLRAMLLVSGIYDLSGIPDSFLKDEAKMRADEAKDWSPLTARHRPGPSRIITRGQAETAPFQDQAIAFDTMLKTAGQDTELRLEAGANHLTVVFELSDPETPLGRRLARMVTAS
ncbi:alpha/beta hydrolase [Qingshengfaniella alkalisoli]|uniref:Alpha/beta hydrolase n=1 Tax=Qingshengfaniella alkalisoli TaxID=2599296 RepID=A0A5B8JAF3_9RHOB|nr:alpha/beta hydrolase [Qingshengfaniella alkalisoli]QDY71170.1 alpha/beta hydrolase [Qingshengfaniella alkalisoli]